MKQVSIIIPARNERFLNNTIQDLLKNMRGDTEIIPVLDGYEIPYAKIDDPRVRYVEHATAKGMRAAINSGVAASDGLFLMKIDGHCMVDEGFDVKLMADMQPNWIVIPRRKRLDADNWCIQDNGKPDVDYEYLSFPQESGDWGLHGKIWTDRILERKDKPEFDIDENMSFQGSCWFMNRSYFEFLDLMDEANYGIFVNEAQELGLKAWLSGGKVMINKKTWYAHLHKGKKHGRGYRIREQEIVKGKTFVNKWLDNSTGWKKQALPFSWIIEHFSPVPSWPSDWKDKFPLCTTLAS